MVPSLVKLLSAGFESDNCQVLTPALRTIGNIVTGNEEQTECVINAGALPKLLILLNSKKINIAKEAAWTISNITAGNILQIQAVIDAGILPALISVMESVNILNKEAYFEESIIKITKVLIIYLFRVTLNLKKRLRGLFPISLPVLLFNNFQSSFN